MNASTGVLLATALLAACASSSRLTKPLAGAPPRTVAVLPLEGGNLPPRGRAIVRHLLGSALEQRRYPTLDDELVDQRLALAGHRPWQDHWLPPDAELARLGSELGVQALLVAEGFEDSRLEAGVFFRRGLEGHLRLFDVASGSSIWTADAGSSGSGGVLLSGQAVKALVETFDVASEANFVRHASAIALDVMALLPENTAEAEPRARPQVSSVALRTSRPGEPLRPDDVLEVEARGSPHGRSSITFGARFLDYPLVEVADGVYCGTIRVEPGAGAGEGPGIAAIVDAFGTASEHRRTDQLFVFAAPRLEAPEGLAADVVDRERRQVRLHWNPVSGAREYLLFRSVAGAGSRTLAPVTATTADDAAPGAGTATWFVQARGGKGVWGPKSVPVTVDF